MKFLFLTIFIVCSCSHFKESAHDNMRNIASDHMNASSFLVVGDRAQCKISDEVYEGSVTSIDTAGIFIDFDHQVKSYSRNTTTRESLLGEKEVVSKKPKPYSWKWVPTFSCNHRSLGCKRKRRCYGSLFDRTRRCYGYDYLRRVPRTKIHREVVSFDKTFNHEFPLDSDSLENCENVSTTDTVTVETEDESGESGLSVTFKEGDNVYCNRQRLKIKQLRKNATAVMDNELVVDLASCQHIEAMDRVPLR